MDSSLEDNWKNWRDKKEIIDWAKDNLPEMSLAEIQAISEHHGIPLGENAIALLTKQKSAPASD